MTNGEWLIAPPQGPDYPGIDRISTDSRAISENALFLALEGERFNGHDFIDDSINSGAAAVCASEISRHRQNLLSARGIPTLIVADTLRAYQQLARYHRMRFDKLIVVAVTGSSGKTSTKEIVAAILRAHASAHILATEGNTNNQIGVPSNLLKLTHRHTAAVLELGTNSPGEIGILVDLVHPNISILTNIGRVHLEGLMDLDGVLREKTAIFSTLSATANGVAIYPYSLRDSLELRELVAEIKSVTFGTESGADYRVSYEGGGLDGSQFRYTGPRDLQPIEVKWRIPGVHMALNATVGLAVADLLDIDRSAATSALRSCRLPPMRMEVFRNQGICWVNDAYNANPESVMAFIDWLRCLNWTDQESGSKYIILGDMLELGKNECQLHHDILVKTKSKLPGMVVIAVGERMVAAAAGLEVQAFEKIENLRKWLFQSDRLQPGDTVALKGSRGVAMEQLLPTERD